MECGGKPVHRTLDRLLQLRRKNKSRLRTILIKVKRRRRFARPALHKKIPMNENYAELITGFPLFKGFTANGTKRLLDAGAVKDHAAGAVLLKEGDTSDFVLLVLSGQTRSVRRARGQGFGFD